MISLLGRQHYVDGIYHDLTSDLVFVFTGMKFYSFAANEFKVSFLAQTRNNNNIDQSSCSLLIHLPCPASRTRSPERLEP